MNTIKLPVQRPDGLFVQYYTVQELKFGETTFEAVIGAWANVEDAAKNNYPELTLSVTLPHNGISTATDGLLERICALPDWGGSVIIDLGSELLR